MSFCIVVYCECAVEVCCDSSARCCCVGSGDVGRELREGADCDRLAGSCSAAPRYRLHVVCYVYLYVECVLLCQTELSDAVLQDVFCFRLTNFIHVMLNEIIFTCEVMHRLCKVPWCIRCSLH